MKFPKPVHKKKKKVRKVKKGTLKRKADKIFSQFIRSLDHCEKCGSYKNLQTSHVYSRRYINLRYDVKNVLCLCAKCHFEWHQSPLEAMMWFNQAYPERVKYLVNKKKIIKKWTLKDYLQAIEVVKNYIR